ncbi:hypothetical protein CIHG_05934 [Coccidioides immitis H538.4]|uniref:Uncharacterized protein n=1 Tax=Coccidioides immitis H538.4 TaxID=396776 RepID=A0A0J8RSH6_COCIT|nr:hypothetical protein CIHG_05934 [Coccidioides immitis H538.4]
MVLQRLELELAEEEDGWVKHGGNHNLNQSQTPAAVCKIWAPGIATGRRLQAVQEQSPEPLNWAMDASEGRYESESSFRNIWMAYFPSRRWG